MAPVRFRCCCLSSLSVTSGSSLKSDTVTAATLSHNPVERASWGITSPSAVVGTVVEGVVVAAAAAAMVVGEAVSEPQDISVASEGGDLSESGVAEDEPIATCVWNFSINSTVAVCEVVDDSQWAPPPVPSTAGTGGSTNGITSSEMVTRSSMSETGATGAGVNDLGADEVDDALEMPEEEAETRPRDTRVSVSSSSLRSSSSSFFFVVVASSSRRKSLSPSSSLNSVVPLSSVDVVVDAFFDECGLSRDRLW